MLNFKDRSKSNLKKVMIYGNDGTGKSTFAEQYCKEHGLNPVVFDIDDTNYTNLPILEVDLGNDIKTYKNIKKAIDEIKSSEFDTIILDGVTSLLEMLVSKAKGLKKYSDRAERFQDILRSLLSSSCHLIFIGQADMEVIYNEEFQSSKMVIKVNSLVNEKYLCYKKKEGFSHKVVKFRGVKNNTSNEHLKTNNSSDKGSVFTTADKTEQIDLDPVSLNYARSIKASLEETGTFVNKLSMKNRLIALIEKGDINSDLEDKLLAFIEEHCPEELE